MSYSLNIRGKLFWLDSPKVMGIINMTPDSFYSGSKYSQEKAVLTKVEEMVAEGVAIVDIGGMSSRPGATIISPEEERKRILPAIQMIRHQFQHLPISVDTLHSDVAVAALESGADIINDISGGQHDQEIWTVAARWRAPYIAMHMQGTPATMQDQPQYQDVVVNVFDHINRQVQAIREAGVQDVIIDPGFGFGKSLAHNYQLLMHLDFFSQIDCPLLIGLSRKSMINKVIGTTPEQALNGTTALHMIALSHGANILRVHDVRPAVEAIQLFTYAQRFA